MKLAAVAMKAFYLPLNNSKFYGYVYATCVINSVHEGTCKNDTSKSDGQKSDNGSAILSKVVSALK